MWRMCRGSPHQRARLDDLLKFGGGGPMPLCGSPHDRSFMTTSDHPGVVSALDAETIINALAAMGDVAVIVVDPASCGSRGCTAAPSRLVATTLRRWEVSRDAADVYGVLWESFGPLFYRAIAGETVTFEGRSLV